MANADTLSNIGVVLVAPTAPPIGFDGDLWFNSTTNSLSVSKGGAWVAVGGGGTSAPEVHVGATTPVGAELIWVDTSLATTTVRYLVAGAWDNGIDGGRW